MISRLFTIIAIGMAGFWIAFFIWSEQTDKEAIANSAAYTLSNSVKEWHSDFLSRSKQLPSDYPKNLNQLIDFGYITKDLFDLYERNSRFNYISPSAQASSVDTPVVRTFTAHYVYTGTLEGSVSKAQKRAEQGAAANP